ncbi:MAG: plasma membrane H+-ATPase [Watsoniomyces obsoletus]|nr:MAG: plasma membrane H+-ATPase [Watsoniomyces obsoletus]
MAPPGEIPGFYYDEEKKKYFKILRNHLAPPDAPYSRESIKQKARETKRQKKTERHNPPSTPIRPSPILHHPLGGAIGLLRETVPQTPHELLVTRSRAYAACLTNGSRITLDPCVEITALACDPLTGAIYLGSKGTMMSYVDRCKRSSSNANWVMRMVGACGNDITSLVVQPGRTVRYTTRTEPSGAQPLVQVLDLLKVVDGFDYLTSNYIYEPSWEFWASTMHPTVDTYAIATSAGVLCVDTLYPIPPGRSYMTPSTTDVFAVEFLSEWTLAAGMRDGGIMIIDRRVGVPNPVPPPIDIQHPGSITHIRSVDGVQMVVNGLEHSLNMYDLRFATPPTKPHYMSTSQHERKKHSTKPILEYPDHNNEYRRNLGFDIDVEMGVVAVGRL